MWEGQTRTSPSVQNAGMEIDTVGRLVAFLDAGGTLAGIRLHGLDLSSCEAVLLSRDDLAGLVVLGGRVTRRLAQHLLEHGAVVFPSSTQSPVDAFRTTLYQADELYAGLAEVGYSQTLDARAYAWSLQTRRSHDVFSSMVCAIHDTGMADALQEIADGAPLVGVMGGHAVRRDEPAYYQAAQLGLELGRRGLVVGTGGGPGAMEAVNLGASCADRAELDWAVAAVADVSTFTGHVEAWARAAFKVRAGLRSTNEGSDSRPVRSVGVPTWFHGHEPPNVFCDAIAKFFSNAVREDELLARCSAGLVVLPGAAGTVQEIFQGVTPRYYANGDLPIPPVVLVGRDHWTHRLPVWPVLTALAEQRSLSRAIHLVEDTKEAAALLTCRPVS